MDCEEPILTINAIFHNSVGWFRARGSMLVDLC
jgi:hypothetical protein